MIFELFEAGEIVSAPLPTAHGPITTDFDRIYALNWLTGEAFEIPLIRKGKRGHHEWH